MPRITGNGKIVIPKNMQILSEFVLIEIIKAVRNSVDYLICLWDESVFKGAGTHAEVTLAYDCKKPVYLINKLKFLI